MKKYSLLLFIMIIISPYIVLSSLKGDINSDGKVNTQDYILVRKHILGTKLTGDYLNRADINGDGKVSIADYIYIRKVIIDPSLQTGSSYVITKDYIIPSGYYETGNAYDSKTLKYKVIKKSDTYLYFALIWVEDAYHQLNCGNSNYTTQYKLTHFNNEIGEMGYQTKGMIGTNGGFAINGRDNIPVLVTKGVYTINENYRTTYNGSNVVYGTLSMNSSSKLINKTSSNATEMETWLKSNGARNAWAVTDFTTNTNQPTAVENIDARTNICQIDEQNFVLSVGYVSKIHHVLHDTFNCIAVANLDGGGSTGMYYKTDTMGRINAIYQYKRPSEKEYRKNVDILYFNEK